MPDYIGNVVAGLSAKFKRLVAVTGCLSHDIILQIPGEGMYRRVLHLSRIIITRLASQIEQFLIVDFRIFMVGRVVAFRRFVQPIHYVSVKARFYGILPIDYVCRIGCIIRRQEGIIDSV